MKIFFFQQSYTELACISLILLCNVGDRPVDAILKDIGNAFSGGGGGGGGGLAGLFGGGGGGGLGETIGGTLFGAPGAAVGGLFDSSSSSSEESNDEKNDHTNRQVEPPKDGVPEDALMYGADIFIQSSTESRRFLVITKKDGKFSNPGTRDPWKDYKEDDYKWELLKPSGRGGVTSDDCIRYGDTVLVKAAMKDVSRKWLYNNDGNDARTGEYNDGEPDKFKVVVRSSPREDGDPKVTSDDPAYGQCVINKSKVFLQSYYKKYRWLEGKKKDASNWGDYYDSEEPEVQQRFHWILRNETGSGDTDVSIDCIPKGAVGRWKYLNFASGGDFSMTITEGNSRTKDESNTVTETWSTSVSATVTANFAAASVSGTVTGTYGGDASKTVSESLMTNKDETHTTTWYTPGAIWQYVIEMGDLCVPHWEVTTTEVIQTPSRQQEPCCLPGFFADMDPNTGKPNPRGRCVGDSPCMCDDFCNDPSRGGTGTAAPGGDEDDARCKYGTEAELRAKGCFHDDNSGGSSGGSPPASPGDQYGGYPMYDNYYGGGGGYPMYDNYYGGGGGYPMYNDYYGGGGGYPMYDDYYGGGGGMYDDYYGGYGGHGGHGHGHGHGGHGPATQPPNPLLGYTGDKPLISLNINQANTNNNQGQNGNNNPPPTNAPTAPPAEEDDYYPPGYDDDYQADDYLGDDYHADDYHADDDDFNAGDVVADDDADADDYLDVVLDALDDVEINARRKLRGASTTTTSA